MPPDINISFFIQIRIYSNRDPVCQPFLLVALQCTIVDIARTLLFKIHYLIYWEDRIEYNHAHSEFRQVYKKAKGVILDTAMVSFTKHTQVSQTALQK